MSAKDFSFLLADVAMCLFFCLVILGFSIAIGLTLRLVWFMIFEDGKKSK